MFRKLRRQLAYLFLAALLFLVGNAIISFWSLSTLYKNNLLVVHTLDILEKVESVRADITSAEANQRGYLLTGNTQFLEPYEQGLQDVGPMIDQLAELTSDNPEQVRNIAGLRYRRGISYSCAAPGMLQRRGPSYESDSDFGEVFSISLQQF